MIFSGFFRPMSRVERISWLSTAVAIGAFLGVFFNHVYCGYYLGRGFPKNSFVEAPQYFANDFTRVYHVVENRSPVTDMERFIPGGATPYPPASLAFMWLFTFLPMKVSLAVYLFLFLLGFLLLNRRYFSFPDISSAWKSVLVLTCLTHPFLYSMDRVNLDMFTFLFSAFGVAAYKEGRGKTAAVLWVMAAAMKIYPALFLFFFLRDRRYPLFVISSAAGLLLTFASWMLFKEGVSESLQYFLLHLSQSKVYFFIPFEYRCLSLAPYFRAGLKLLGVGTELMAPGPLIVLYNAFSLALLGAGFWVIKRGALRQWEELLVLTLLMVLLPNMSHYYKLMFFFIPLYGFATEERPSPYDLIYCVLFALILIPKNYDKGVESVVNMGSLLVLSCLVVARGLFPRALESRMGAS